MSSEEILAPSSKTSVVSPVQKIKRISWWVFSFSLNEWTVSNDSPPHNVSFTWGPTYIIVQRESSSIVSLSHSCSQCVCRYVWAGSCARMHRPTRIVWISVVSTEPESLRGKACSLQTHHLSTLARREKPMLGERSNLAHTHTSPSI